MSILIPQDGVAITATASYVPTRRVTSRELASREGAPLTEADILKRTGVAERRWAAPEQATSDLAIAAGREILKRATISTVDRLLVATVSPDYPSPATACIVQRGLGLAPAPAMDVVAACSGFVYALDAGVRSILTGEKRTLVLAADVRSRFIDLDDLATSALFGDGAGGVLLEPGPREWGILGISLQADGSGAEQVHVPAGGSRLPASQKTVAERQHVLRMTNGMEIASTVVEGIAVNATGLLTALGVTLRDVDLVIPHQANGRILKNVQRRMELPPEKMFINIDRVGNTAGASLPLALDEAVSTGRVKPGSLVLLVAAGAGFTVGSALWRVPPSFMQGRAREG